MRRTPTRTIDLGAALPIELAGATREPEVGDAAALAVLRRQHGIAAEFTIANAAWPTWGVDRRGALIVSIAAGFAVLRGLWSWAKTPLRSGPGRPS